MSNDYTKSEAQSLLKEFFEDNTVEYDAEMVCPSCGGRLLCIIAVNTVDVLSDDDDGVTQVTMSDVFHCDECGKEIRCVE